MKEKLAEKESIFWSRAAIRNALAIFVILRIFFSIWGFTIITISPPHEDDLRLNVIGQRLGLPAFEEGWKGVLLAPWQRFDGMRYTRIAAEGYTHEADSAFMPLYPLGIRLLGKPFGGTHAAHLVSGIFISNLACLALFILLYRVTELEIGTSYARRTLIYLAIFPTSFFLIAPYSESLFILLTLASLWSGRNGRFQLAGVLGFFASQTRLMGWILVVPLAYECWQQRLNNGRWRTIYSWKFLSSAFFILLPGLGMLSFLIYRQAAGLPPLDQLYNRYWQQGIGFPGVDIWHAVQAAFFGMGARAGSPSVLLDLGITFLLLITTAASFHYLPRFWGIYAILMLFFILLPTSLIKPLYSFSRYALPFFTLFFIMGIMGKRPLINRLILYPSFILLLLFSAIFFMWGFVA